MKYNRTQQVREVDGQEVVFDSTEESKYYDILLEKERNGEISKLTLQPQFVLLPNFWFNEEKVNAMVYTPDFGYIDNATGKRVIIEVKGIPTPEFELRLKLWKYIYKDKNIVFKMMMYSQSTGWREEKEYKQLRKQIKQENYKARVLREHEEINRKLDNIRNRIVKYESLEMERPLKENEKQILENARKQAKIYQEQLKY